jgi:cytochrome c oxidase subunit 1
VLVGGSLIAHVGGLYFWFPKMTGRGSVTPRQDHFWLWTIGFVATFMPQYQLGADGCRAAMRTTPRPRLGTLNLVSTMGSLLLGSGSSRSS